MRAPPYSIEAEQSVLGALLNRNDLLDEIAGVVSQEDFYRADHRIIWDALCSVIGKRQQADFVTLAEWLTQQGLLEDAGGLSYLGHLANDTPSLSNATTYAQIVGEKASLRKLIGAATEAADGAFSSQPLPEILDALEKRLYALRQGHPVEGASIFSAMQGAVEMAERARIGCLGMPTGLQNIDDLIGGMMPGQLIIIAGRPSMGKSTLALNIAEHVAARDIPVQFFSLEMSKEELAMRTLANKANLPLGNLRMGRLEDMEWDRVSVCQSQAASWPLWLDDSGTITAFQLAAKARKQKPKLIIVDYLQLMSGEGDNDNARIEAISRALKLMAKDLQIPVIALSQLNRGLESRENKRPRMSDLRSSGAIEQDADVVLFVYRDWVYDRSQPEDHAEVIVGKQRNGRLGTAHMRFEGQYCRFTEGTSPEEGGSGFE